MIKGITFVHAASTPAVYDTLRSFFSALGLEPGQILAFLGHNGAGKTTTLKTIMGIIEGRAGEISFDGHRIDRLPVADRVAAGLRRTHVHQRVRTARDLRENLSQPFRVARDAEDRCAPPGQQARRFRSQTRRSTGHQRDFAL